MSNAVNPVYPVVADTRSWTTEGCSRGKFRLISTQSWFCAVTVAFFSQTAATMAKTYAAVPSDEDGGVAPRSLKLTPIRSIAMTALCVVFSSAAAFGLGFVLGQGWPTSDTARPQAVASDLLPPQAFIPPIPLKNVEFEFPTPYEGTDIDGDKLWRDLMPG